MPQSIWDQNVASQTSSFHCRYSGVEDALLQHTHSQSAIVVLMSGQSGYDRSDVAETAIHVFRDP